MHDRPFYTVLDVWRVVAGAEHSLVVGLVAGHENPDGPIGVPPATLQFTALGGHRATTGNLGQCSNLRVLLAAGPRPGVPEPQRRQHVQRRVFRAAVVHGHVHQQVFRRRLRILDHDIEVPVVVEYPRVEQLVLGIDSAACPVTRDEIGIWEFRLRIFVQHLQIRRSGRGVEIVVTLLDVLAVIALGISQPEQPLLEHRVAPVPQGQRHAQQLVVVAYAGQSVLAPPVGAITRLIMRERGPRVTAVAGVLAHGAPLPLTQIRSPPPPADSRPVGLVEALPLRADHRAHLSPRHGEHPGSDISLIAYVISDVATAPAVCTHPSGMRFARGRSS